MSARQFFSEVEAVCTVLDEWVQQQDAEDGGDEVFTAIWQAVELLSRAYSVLLPQVQAEAAKGHLLIPDPVVVPDAE